VKERSPSRCRQELFPLVAVRIQVLDGSGRHG